jgi:hypothetical protein
MNNDKPIDQQLTAQFLGGFMDGFAMLSAGDSAVLRMPIDSAFKGGQLPPFAKSGDKVTYVVKIFSVKSAEEFENEKKEAGAKQISIDDKIIQDYISENNKVFLFMGEGQHKIKRKAEQIACNEALKFISDNDTINE